MEFKRLSEIETGTATDNTNVIAEVDGVLKRIPKKEVGGAGGYIMELNSTNFDQGQMICTANYDEMYDVLMEGGNVWLSISDEPNQQPTTYDALNITNYGNDNELICQWTITDMGLVVTTFNFRILFTNGSHNLPSINQEPS